MPNRDVIHHVTIMVVWRFSTDFHRFILNSGQDNQQCISNFDKRDNLFSSIGKHCAISADDFLLLAPISTASVRVACVASVPVRAKYYVSRAREEH